MPCSCAKASKRAISPSVNTLPVGLVGREQQIAPIFARFEFGQVFQCVKVHAVFEEACFAFVFDVFDFGLDGNEVLPFNMHVGIADVFGRERQQNGFFCGCAV